MQLFLGKAISYGRGAFQHATVDVRAFPYFSVLACRSVERANVVDLRKDRVVMEVKSWL